jgi:uncharacterized membrane protein
MRRRMTEDDIYINIMCALDIVVVILTVVVGRRKKRSIGDIWTFS